MDEENGNKKRKEPAGGFTGSDGDMMATSTRKMSKLNTAQSVVNNNRFSYAEDSKDFFQNLFPVPAYTFNQARKTQETEVESAEVQILKNPGFLFSSNIVIEDLLEHYIITQFEKEENKNKNLKFNCTDFSNQEREFYFNYQVVAKIPKKRKVPKKENQNTLFIPELRNYPCADLFYYDYKEHILYPIQITLSFENQKPSHKKFLDKYFALWKQEFTKEGKELRMKFIWIGGKWDPDKLAFAFAYHNARTPSVTQDSWKVEYKQLPYSIFPAFLKRKTGLWEM